MAYIYKIGNDINDKVYIGKTQFSIKKRFDEHCSDCQRRKNENRPLYSAMRKYGIEHFYVELIEQTDYPNEREIYWIEQYNSYKNGYNATKGGEGKRKYDYDLIYNLFSEGKTIHQIAQELNYDEGWCSKILDSYGITYEEREKRHLESISKKVAQLDLNTEEILNIFPSCSEALRFLGKSTHSPHISDVCKGKRKSAYGYKWKFINSLR